MKIYRIGQEKNSLFDHYRMDYEYPYNFDDFISYFGEYDLQKDKVISFAKAKGLSIKDFSFALNIENKYWFSVNNNSCDLVDIYDWIVSLDENKILEYLNISDSDLYIADIGTLNDIRENPGTVYHYTNEESLEKIKKSGFVGQSFGSGMGNRNAYGLFVSTNAKEYADGLYGNVLLTINLTLFKEKEGLPYLSIDVEPEYKEYLCKQALCSRLGFEYNGELSKDISINTFIVQHNIPLKYVTINLK